MILTIDKWSDQIANNIGKSNGLLFKSTLKDLIVQEYATLIKQSVDRNGYTKSLITSIYVPVIRSASSPLEKTRKIILYVSKFKIKQPLRNSNSLSLFTFVGSKDGSVSYIPSSFEELNFISHVPLVSEAIRYIYENDYIYLVSPTPIKRIKVSSIFTDLTMCYDEIGDASYTGLNPKEPDVRVSHRTDIELDIPYDIVNRINTKLLTEQFGSTNKE